MPGTDDPESVNHIRIVNQEHGLLQDMLLGKHVQSSHNRTQSDNFTTD